MRRALRFFSVSVFQKQKKLNSLKSNNLSFCDRKFGSREGTQSSHSKNYFVFGGILSIFGVNQEKPKEEDPILTTIKNAILSIQRGAETMSRLTSFSILPSSKLRWRDKRKLSLMSTV